jgi:CRISPR-associated protein Csm4
MSQQHFNVYKLYFKTALHLSRGKNNSYESSDHVLHSDTIKSALYATMRLLISDEVLLQQFLEQVTVSSAFPFTDDASQTTYWLPRPLNYRSDRETPDNRKEYKKINYVLATQMAKILSGQHPDDFLDAQGKSKQPEIWQRDTTQRVKINYGDDSEPFYLEKLYPKNPETSGLYFIVQGDFDSKILHATLNLMGENGIGLQKNLGNGQFRWTTQESGLQLEVPEKRTHWVNLSLFRPKRAAVEAILDKSTYQFMKRGGWIASSGNDRFLSIRKKAIMMFTEGSVFAFGDAAATGVIENLRPDWDDTENKLHPIYRDGKAIFLPMLIL